MRFILAKRAVVLALLFILRKEFLAVSCHFKKIFFGALMVMSLIACGGGGGRERGVSAPDLDSVPDRFVFVAKSDVALDTLIESNSISVTGIDTATAVSVSGGEYSIDGSNYTNAAGTVSNGQTVTLRQVSSIDFDTATTTSLNIGGVSADFIVTTRRNSAPTAKILFPPAVSSTNASSIVIRGTATDLEDDNITALRVNGIDAVSVDNFATWSATVPLSPGGNTLNVETGDAAGSGDLAAASVVIESGFFLSTPQSIAFDNVNNRILVLDDTLDALIAVDPMTGQGRVVSDANTGTGIQMTNASVFVLDVANGRAIVGDGTDRGELAGILLSIDLETGDRTLVSGRGVGIGPRFFSLDSVVYDMPNDRVLALAHSLFEVSLSTGDRSIISNDSTGNGPAFMAPSALSYDEVNNRVFVADTDRIIEVDLSTGDRTIISGDGIGAGDSFSFPQGMAYDGTNNRVYIVDRVAKALLAVDLATGDRSIVSDANTGLGDPYDFITAISLDLANNRAIILDKSRGLFAADLTTGDRSTLKSNSVGSGIYFDLPLSVTFDGVNQRAYVSDFSGDIFAVDLDSGNRRVVFSSGKNGSIESLAYDNDRVFFVWAGGSGGRSVLSEVNVSTGEGRLISGDTTGDGLPFFVLGSVDYDAVNHRAFAVDQFLDAMLSIDIASGNRGIVSSADMGVGPNLSNLTSVAFDGANNRALVTDKDNLMSINISSGDRAIISDASIGAGPVFHSPSSSTLDEVNNRVLIVAKEGIFAVDLSTGNRAIISNNAIGSGPLYGTIGSIAYDTESNRALVSVPAQDALFAVDLINGQRVIWSR